MKNFKIVAALMMLAVLLCSACQTEYERQLKEGLASGEKYDTLFLGVKLGMSSEEFYDHCWALNREQKVQQGPSNASVEYELPGLKAPALMNFYPNFYRDTIQEMLVEINYKAWAPWNKNLWSDSLLMDVQHLFEQWYGGSVFFTIHHKVHGDRLVKIDGNRRILLWKKNDSYIKATFTDMTTDEAASRERKVKTEVEEKT